VGHGTTNHDYDKLALEGALTYISEYFSDPFYDRPSSHQPLMLKVSLNRPHYPYFTDEDRFNYYLNRVQPYFDQEVSGHPFLSKHRVRIGEDVTPRDVQRATAAYYGMIDEVDHDFGQIVQALHQHGQNLDEWIILFTADHGEMLGEHGVWEKQVFYEASAKVPLFIRPPQAGPARHIDANVSTCDLFATLCDLVGFDLPPDRSLTPAGKLDSRSLVGLMTGDATEWDDYAVSEFEGLNLMLKHGNLKYQYYARESCDRPEHREVLFDLSRDPLESRNVFDDPGYAEAMQRFREHPLTEDYRNRAKG
jgi:choline-sulfatase